MKFRTIVLLSLVLLVAYFSYRYITGSKIDNSNFTLKAAEDHVSSFYIGNPSVRSVEDTFYYSFDILINTNKKDVYLHQLLFDIQLDRDILYLRGDTAIQYTTENENSFWNTNNYVLAFNESEGNYLEFILTHQSEERSQLPIDKGILTTLVIKAKEGDLDIRFINSAKNSKSNYFTHGSKDDIIEVTRFGISDYQNADKN